MNKLPENHGTVLIIELQSIIIALMKTSGLGFLIIALLLMVLPFITYFKYDSLVQYIIPGISFLYCFGLFLINYQLAFKTKAKTPWKGSLYAALLIGIGIIISFMQSERTCSVGSFVKSTLRNKKIFQIQLILIKRG